MKAAELIFSMAKLQKVVVVLEFLEILKRYHLTESYREVLVHVVIQPICFSVCEV